MDCRLLTSILERSSYRGRYTNQPVGRDVLRAVMEAGLAAPSGCNRQTTSLIAVDDQALLDSVKRAIDPPIFETAPAAICVLTRKTVAYRNRCFHVQDYAAAVENMLVAIKALGCESCWYEGHITDDDDIAGRVARILGVPSELSLVCILPVGYAAEPPSRAAKLAFDERAWFNGYQSQD